MTMVCFPTARSLQTFYATFHVESKIHDPFLGTVAGSISAGSSSSYQAHGSCRTARYLHVPSMLPFELLYIVDVTDDLSPPLRLLTYLIDLDSDYESTVTPADVPCFSRRNGG